MQKQLITWQLINDSLQQHVPVMLLYVLQSNGSSPGRAGFVMAVNAAGAMEGSIGGGIMEHKFTAMAREQLQQSTTNITIRQQVHDKQAAKDQSGMICSGDQTILLYPVKAADAAAVQEIIACLQNHRHGVLQLSPQGLQFEATDLAGEDYYFTQLSATDWRYRGRIGYRDHLFIIGGGHCALALSELMQRLDFYVHVYDDRPELHTLLQNDYAHEKHVVSDYRELAALIPSGSRHYVVIMTFGYRTDDVAIRALLDKRFRYLGVLGSKSKIARMFEGYMDEGIPASFLSRVHAPVGLAINSHTPEEIAVSIAAEMIGVRNGHVAG
ncbi:XdhC family protein [Chitinophaga japonensis]|uniref:Xanthine dehydrogenase accessory factor n=1 Tax=Chitinophaga japonensis TaxID=104662 RepID=A0A562T2R0_CHIJA|nr:XdhC/CoxI family protein [Chitinophaga japonensis]TWI87911.1 xanthine dehydrogenase accessory factor [Chitinophaga japonensis]